MFLDRPYETTSAWHKRNLDVSNACGFVYVVPAALYFFSGFWVTVAMIASVALGLWLSAPKRRWIAIFSLLCAVYPDSGVRFCGWIAGFWLTCFLDGAYKRNPPKPTSDWD